ncbi:MAG TPA: 4-(cytidine 5'-diphospho)-2-C-methyl-D-erythritol kinase [Cyclobacteriaceae bacterium]|nr:4-(cytidine 5'-diphospho)-2-C-methyl-D-erythritol kinase [Cyclobacteriaceae bacterium]
MVSFPFCKINLGLRVLSRREDGYHNIETCFYPVPWCDVLEAIPSKRFSFDHTGLPIAGTGNLCVRAYDMLKEGYGLPPVKMHLHKIIPMGAGLGGGSADAAFTLKSLNALFSLGLPHDKLVEIAAGLGSDCPFFLHEKAMLGTGRGEVLAPANVSLAGRFLVIVKPDAHIPTKDAYKEVTPDASGKGLAGILMGNEKEWKDALVNDFEKGVFSQYPEVRMIKNTLYGAGAFYASMSGSGSAVYGLFDGPVRLRGKFKGMSYWSGTL